MRFGGDASEEVRSVAVLSLEAYGLAAAKREDGIAWAGFIAKCSGVDVVGGETGEIQMTSDIERIEGSVEPKNLAPGDKLDIRLINLGGSPRVQLRRVGGLTSAPVVVRDGRAPKRD